MLKLVDILYMLQFAAKEIRKRFAGLAILAYTNYFKRLYDYAIFFIKYPRSDFKTIINYE